MLGIQILKEEEYWNNNMKNNIIPQKGVMISGRMSK